MVVQLEGSSLVESINNKFSATMTNAVRWRDAAGGGAGNKQISSDTSIRVTLEVPTWLGFVSLGAVEATGSKVSAAARQPLLASLSLGLMVRAWPQRQRRIRCRTRCDALRAQG